MYCIGWLRFGFPAGIVDTPGDSLFYYEQGESWVTYFDPYFEPVYQPHFENPDLETEAAMLCGDDTSCLFDIAATGNLEIGLATLQTSQEIERINEISIPSNNSYIHVTSLLV